MAKILVLSDTHGKTDRIKKLQPLFNECDCVFHLGDYYSDMNEFREQLGNKLYAVKGNCDFGGQPLFVEAFGVKIMAVHGNKYGVKNSLSLLLATALEEKCDLVLYGHTHLEKVETFSGLTVVNPGAVSGFFGGTYAVVEIEDKKINAFIQNV